MNDQPQILPNHQSISLDQDAKILTMDVQYEGEWGYVGIDVLNWENRTFQMVINKEKIEADYQSGFFALREGPILLASIQKIRKQLNITPALLIIDGHGTAHPRKLGLASWIGIKTGIPAIGVAKRILLKIPFQLNEIEGSIYEIIDNETVIGTILRTQTGVKPVFVSAGHLISQQEAVNIIKSLRGAYRIIEPMRRADQIARKFAKGFVHKETVSLVSV